MTVDHQGKENAFIRLEGSILWSRFGATWLCEIGNKAKLKPKRKGRLWLVDEVFTCVRNVFIHKKRTNAFDCSQISIDPQTVLLSRQRSRRRDARHPFPLSSSAIDFYESWALSKNPLGALKPHSSSSRHHRRLMRPLRRSHGNGSYCERCWRKHLPHRLFYFHLSCAFNPGFSCEYLIFLIFLQFLFESITF